MRWRLMAWVAAVMLGSAAIVLVVVYKDTGTELRGQMDRDIAGDTEQLAQALRPLRGRSPARIISAASRYVRLQPYSANSTLLLVIVPGAGTASNHPELFSQTAPDEGETQARQDVENAESRNLAVPHIGYTVQRVPDVGRVRILERQMSVGRVGVVVGSGEPLAIVESAQQGVARTFLLAGALTIALALLASYLAGARVSAPLRRLAALASRVGAGDLEPRMEVEPHAGSEVRVLAESFNAMLDRLSEAFDSQRKFIADASHELRTPLTVIRGQLELLAVQDNPGPDEIRRVERLAQAEIARISRLVNDLLLLAQAEEMNFLRIERIAVAPFVADLWDGISLTAERRYEVGVLPDGALDADPDRLAQALRNLARNAIEHTSGPDGLVRLEVDRVGSGRIRFTVLDDGPGIPVSERERVFERFHRTDPARSRSVGGAGLGLAIVRAVAEAHGGDVAAREPGAGGGARIELVLPGFHAGRPSFDGERGPRGARAPVAD